MVEMIQERQSAEKGQRHDLFSNLLGANDHTLDVTTLSEDEKMSASVCGLRISHSSPL
jgi:hypothetical protein